MDPSLGEGEGAEGGVQKCAGGGAKVTAAFGEEGRLAPSQNVHLAGFCSLHERGGVEKHA